MTPGPREPRLSIFCRLAAANLPRTAAPQPPHTRGKLATYLIEELDVQKGKRWEVLRLELGGPVPKLVGRARSEHDALDMVLARSDQTGDIKVTKLPPLQQPSPPQQPVQDPSQQVETELFVPEHPNQDGLSRLFALGSVYTTQSFLSMRASGFGVEYLPFLMHLGSKTKQVARVEITEPPFPRWLLDLTAKLHVTEFVAAVAGLFARTPKPSAQPLSAK